MAARARLVVVFLLCGCAAPRPFTLAEPVWSDDDRRPFKPAPASYLSPAAWDFADNTFFRPISDFLALKTGREAINVNALDEVPDSSWFTNRIGRRPMSPEEVARGPCTKPSPETAFPWKVIGAKLDGANVGFRIITSTGVRYLLKFDEKKQPERATAADAVGSKLYHAAGFHVPCDLVVFFSADQLTVPESGAAMEGKPLSRQRVDELLELVPTLPDGRFRAMASELLTGEVLGPWTYAGTRGDDPNDVIPHEDRRELRGSRLLGAWINHFDAREQNSLAMWIADGNGKGHVEHYLIDWGDTLGSLWEQEQISRRLGYTYYLDFGAIGEGLVNFGAVEGPWDRAQFGPAGPTFGYFNDTDFDPESWHGGYPNPAFSSMTERDGAWMARIIARFDDATLKAVVEQARFSNPLYTAELERILRSRRDRILARYLGRLSSLNAPRLEPGEANGQLCVRDASPWPAISSPIALAHLAGEPRQVFLSLRTADGEICFELPSNPGQYVVVDVWGTSGQFPARIHLARDTGAWQVVGLERPQQVEPPPVPSGPRPTEARR